MSHVCSECDFTTKWSYNFRRHFMRVHEGVTHDISTKNNPSSTKNNPSSTKNNPSSTKENPCFFDKNQCDKCEKIFAKHCTKVKHYEKCKGKINKLQCDICNEVFTLSQAKYRHQKNCKIKKEKEKEKEEQQQKVIIQNQTINNITNNINNITNNIIIQLNDFEAFNSLIEHVTPEKEEECSGKGYLGARDMIDHIYFNPEYPKNHNIKLNSIKHGTVQVYTKNNWEMRSLSEISPRISKRIISMLMSCIRLDQVFEEGDAMFRYKLFYPNIVKSIEPPKTEIVKLNNHIKAKLIERKNENQNTNLLQ